MNQNKARLDKLINLQRLLRMFLPTFRSYFKYKVNVIEKETPLQTSVHQKKDTQPTHLELFSI